MEPVLPIPPAESVNVGAGGIIHAGIGDCNSRQVAVGVDIGIGSGAGSTAAGNVYLWSPNIASSADCQTGCTDSIASGCFMMASKITV